MTNSVMIGSQTPRVGNWPEYDSTAGDKVFRLAELLGIPLDEWQKYVIRHALGEVVDPATSKKTWAAYQVGLVVPRQNGKTFILDMLILGALFLFDEKVVLTSQSLKASETILLRVADIIKNSPAKLGLRKKLPKRWLSRKNGNYQILLSSGASLSTYSRGKDSGRSFTMDRLINDEAYDYAEIDQAALEPMLSARPNPQIWYVSTPPLNALTGEPFTKLRTRGLAKAEGVAWFEWGADPDKKLDLDDRAVWAAANPAYNVRIREATIAAERESLTDADFARERLGVWPVKVSNSLISAADWAAIADTDSVMPSPVAFAVDITPARSHACIAAYGVREDGIGHVELAEYGEGTEWLTERLVALKERHNPVAIAVDIAGPAGTLVLDLAKAGITEPKDKDKPEYGDLVIVRSGSDIGAACGQLVDAVKQKRFVHPNDPTLNLAVANAVSRTIGDGAFGWDRKKPTTDISPLVAATLARYAFVSREHLVRREYDVMNSVWFGGGE